MSALQHCFAHNPAAVLQVRITPLTTKRVEHSGIKVQLLGQIELASERGSPHDFVSLGALSCVSQQQQQPEARSMMQQCHQLCCSDRGCRQQCAAAGHEYAAQQVELCTCCTE
jgi:hypothetical protein